MIYGALCSKGSDIKEYSEVETVGLYEDSSSDKC